MTGHACAARRYLFFARDLRPTLQQEHPSASMVEIAKILGGRWRALNEVGRQPFELQAKEDKIRFQKAMEAYTPRYQVPTHYGMAMGQGGMAFQAGMAGIPGQHQMIAHTMPGKYKAPGKYKYKDPRQPKRPLSAYIFFSQHLRPQLQTEHPESDMVRRSSQSPAIILLCLATPPQSHTPARVFRGRGGLSASRTRQTLAVLGAPAADGDRQDLGRALAQLE